MVTDRRYGKSIIDETVSIEVIKPQFIENNVIHEFIHISNGIKRISRLSVFFLLLLISWMFRFNLIILESIVGICFISISTMIIPVSLYLKSFWFTLSCLNKFIHIILIIFIIMITFCLFTGCIISLT